MDTTTTSTLTQYIKQVMDLTHSYDNVTCDLNIIIKIGDSNQKIALSSRPENNNYVKIVYDPEYKFDGPDSDSIYICYSLADLKELVEYVMENQELFTCAPSTDDVYDKDGVIADVSYILEDLDDNSDYSETM